MKLYASATSPFARKVRIALIELGLADRVAITGTNPLEDAAFRSVNPLAKIPALELEDGTVLYDSAVIVTYLDALDGGNRLIPADPFARVAELRRHALADGILDAAVSIAFERRRPAEQQSPDWIARWSETVAGGAARLAGELDAQAFGLAGITAAVAAEYIAFRLPEVAVPALAAWREALPARQSLDQTHPSLGLTPA